MFDSTCEIRRANIRGDGRAQLDLKADNGAFDWSWFFSPADHANQVLAVVLTVIATNRRVSCTINDPVQPETEVVRSLGPVSPAMLLSGYAITDAETFKAVTGLGTRSLACTYTWFRYVGRFGAEFLVESAHAADQAH